MSHEDGYLIETRLAMGWPINPMMATRPRGLSVQLHHAPVQQHPGQPLPTGARAFPKRPMQAESTPRALLWPGRLPLQARGTPAQRDMTQKDGLRKAQPLRTLDSTSRH